VELVTFNINFLKHMQLNFKNENELVRYCEEYMQKKNEYNGWSNYATWRINLELVAGASYEKDECGQEFEDVHELASYIKENIVLLLGDEVGGYCEGLNNDYALAFISDVNWYEIAKNISEYNDNIIILDK